MPELYYTGHIVLIYGVWFREYVDDDLNYYYEKVADDLYYDL